MAEHGLPQRFELGGASGGSGASSTSDNTWTGSNTFTQTIQGNATTATALETARAINGVSFDGTTAITVTAAAGTLSGTTLAATVVSSSLTSVGSLSSLTVAGTTALRDGTLGVNSWLSFVDQAGGNGSFVIAGGVLTVDIGSATGFMVRTANGATTHAQLGANGAIFNVPANITVTTTSVGGSTSGTAVFSQPFQGATLKVVVIKCAALIGTAAYTFPTAFTTTPSVIATNDVAAAIATSVSTTAVTMTGTTTTGMLILIGY